ncbi:MAG: citrate synthase [Armatimonadota bacterium]|nr:citrate synthase [Armatimonadota bacterium]
MTGTSMADRGLEDVVALTSTICFIDGREGKLIYQGYDIDDLVAHSTFEETAYLLWHGDLPTAEQLKDLQARLLEERQLPKPILDLLGAIPATAHPMEALRTAVSALAFYDPDAADTSLEASMRKALRLTAKMATIVAAYDRLRHGQAPVPPDPRLGHAANFLYMLKGEQPDDLAQRYLDAALIIHADHELNASTFAARVTAATLSDMYSAITSAIGALKGPLHGGANEQVMKMVLEIGSPERAEQYTREALAAKRRIMGIGHRVYKTYDPRAVYLRRFAQGLGERAGNTTYVEILDRVEKVLVSERGLYPNVDFFSGAAYYLMGIPVDLFTPVFAVSRISGWTAHVLEQYRNNRLIRPRAEYIGPTGRTWVPLEQRG